jgi:hypothetical protein
MLTLPQFLNDQEYEKHAQVASWPLAIIGSSNEQVSTSQIHSRFFTYLDTAFGLSPESLQSDDVIVTPISASHAEPSTPLRRFFTEVMSTVKTFGSQGFVLTCGSASGIEAAEMQSIFYNGPRR